eukprot:2323686-Rhodomonas_salina.2
MRPSTTSPRMVSCQWMVWIVLGCHSRWITRSSFATGSVSGGMRDHPSTASGALSSGAIDFSVATRIFGIPWSSSHPRVPSRWVCSLGVRRGARRFSQGLRLPRRSFPPGLGGVSGDYGLQLLRMLRRAVRVRKRQLGSWMLGRLRAGAEKGDSERGLRT